MRIASRYRIDWLVTAAFIPIRSFDGLTRLAPVLDTTERAWLMRRLAKRTAAAAADAGADVLAVTGDPEVAEWTVQNGYTLVDEPDPPGLNAAAAVAIAGTNEPWMIIHADLPTIAPEDVATSLRALERHGAVIAPSHDGGTSLIGGTGSTFPFSYGVGSFRRHLALARDAAVVVRPGLALDLDRIQDLVALRTLAIL